ncbi:MAG: heavy metal translocating P-type ATPase, partial [Oscillospiraceae bacterium]
MERTLEEHGCAACSAHDHAHQHPETGVETTALISIALAAVLLISALFIPFFAPYRTVLLLLSYLAAGWEVLLEAIKHTLKGKLFDETFLMALASIGAMVIGDMPEGVAVMLFYDVGELFQSLAVGRSRRSIEGLMDIRPDRATLVTSTGYENRAAQAVVPGDVILVKAGERIPLDGTVLDGVSQLDTAALTGESMPREVTVGGAVLAGCVNLTGPLRITVTKPFGESTASKILELVEDAEQNKAPAQQFITKFARYYTPAVVLLATLIAVLPPLFFGGIWSDYIHRALVFLVISCPCALVISVPMGFFAGIGCASKNGILVKGGNFLEALCQVDTMVFDKTGTLTEGKFKLTSIQAVGMEEKTLLFYAAHGEALSNHPIAQSIRVAYGSEPEQRRVGTVTEIAGGGVKTMVDGREVLMGNRRLLESADVAVPPHETAGTAIFLAVDGVYAGVLDIGDTPKPEAKAALAALKALGVRRTVMLTGDRAAAGEAVGRAVGLDAVVGDLLPDGKVAELEKLMGENVS